MKSPQRETLIGMFRAPDTVEMAPASLEGWERILPTLKQRECEVLLALCDAIAAGMFEDFTGAELSDVSGLSVLNVRPRLSGLHTLGLVARGATRASRIRWEQRAHPYRPSVPRAAIERWRQTLNDSTKVGEGA